MYAWRCSTRVASVVLIALTVILLGTFRLVAMQLKGGVCIYHDAILILFHQEDFNLVALTSLRRAIICWSDSERGYARGCNKVNRARSVNMQYYRSGRSFL